MSNPAENTPVEPISAHGDTPSLAEHDDGLQHEQPPLALTEWAQRAALQGQLLATLQVVFEKRLVLEPTTSEFEIIVESREADGSAADSDRRKLDVESLRQKRAEEKAEREAEQKRERYVREFMRDR